MPEASATERLIQRERLLTLMGLVALCALTWLYIALGAGLGMSAWQMTTFALFPYQHRADAMPAMATFASPAHWGVTAWALIILMWWIMMMAMMIPSAAPAILTYGRVYRHASVQGQTVSRPAPTSTFVAGYLLAWLMFSVGAAAFQWALQHVGLISSMMLGAQSRWLSGAILVAAGLYQLSPPKRMCLAHCRAPASFIARHWRPKVAGALRLGVMHGAYCVGCCWLLMALLFVGGVMNLAWIAALAALVMIEKVLHRGQIISRFTGTVLIAWGVVTLMV